jgi:hypothetical protein
VQILGLHIIPGVYKAADFATLTEVKTLGGAILSVSTEGGKVTFTGPDSGTMATVTEADLMSCAGVVHKIDSILVPGIPENPMIEAIVPTPAPAMVEPMPEEPETPPAPMPSPAKPSKGKTPLPTPAPAVVEAVPEQPSPVLIEPTPVPMMPSPVLMKPSPVPMMPSPVPIEPISAAPIEADAPAPGPGAAYEDCPSILDLAIEASDLNGLVQALDVRSPTDVRSPYA